MSKIIHFTRCLKCETNESGNWNINVLKSCERELDQFPQQIIDELVDLLGLLNKGMKLAMPNSKPMPSIYRNCHELRIADKTGAYRIVYFIKMQNGIYLIHAFKKKTQKTQLRNIELARKRIKEIL